MHGAIADFYRKVLELATKKHRREKGGAEKLIREHWDEITAIERKLRQRHQEGVAAEECKFREKMSA